MVFRFISKLYFKFAGWEIVGELPQIKKYVFIVAPHTSQTDFFMGKMYCSIVGLKLKILIKKEAFFFPLGVFLRSIGGVPVDRKKNRHLASELIKEFNSSEEFVLNIAPEGTRKLVKRWKKGFYHIAMSANVPICLSFIDHKTKTIGAGPLLYPTGNYEEDLQIIKDFYRDMEGKHTDRFSVGD